jgi:NADPH-dependent curcumin reductase CurA
MSDRVNRQWRLKARPVGMVKESDFEYVEEPAESPGEGQALVRNFMVAFEPAMRGWMEDVESYVPPVGIGEVMRASTVGVVVESKAEGLAVGDVVTGTLGWQEYPLVDTRHPSIFGGAQKLPPGATAEQALSVFGLTGLTAYFGYLDVGQPKEGDVVLVSGAAGATGSIAAQIARIKGASKVVGIAGGPEKCKWLTETLGLDAAIDYKSEDVSSRIAQTCPDGVDLFFDNVGGTILEAGLDNMAQKGRIVLCGGISAYNEETQPPGPRNYMQLVIRRCRMEGFIVIDYMTRVGEAMVDLGSWVGEGKLVAETDVQHGMENVPKTFLRLFEGKNRGKQLCQIGDAP